jgi:S-DNA-T family DNA segregation ATPase FtsK/SpoIIIE
MFRAYLADFKQGVEFFDFKDYNNASLYSDPDVFIQAVSGENNTRWGLIRNNDSKNIFEYNESVPFDMRLPYCIVVIDEVAMFKVKSSKNSATLLSALVAQTAGAGMYWLLSTQRPSVDIVNGSLKANLNCRISFSQATAVDSEVVFGEGIDNAVQLGNPGRGWCMVSDRFFEFQALFI